MKKGKKERKPKKEKKPTKQQIQYFQSYILGWYEANKRVFPRRNSTNPYHILVAEIMLQQTQALRVVPKFLEFIKEIPTIQDLAYASHEKVLTLRSGLGFNRRALYVKKVAEVICEKYGGKIPDDPCTLRNLPGIGPYTAASIPVFAYNKEIPIIDINIKRVLQTRIKYGFDVRKFASAEKVKNDVKKMKKNGKKDIFPLPYLLEIGSLLIPKGKSREWHNALMDYGSLVLSASKTGISSPKQSPFVGSTRQVRGGIIKMLLTKGPQRMSKLKQLFYHKDFESIIQSLCRENFITITNGIVKVKE